MKILHVLINARPEGTPKLVLDWLQEKECEQSVLFLEDFTGESKLDFPSDLTYTNPTLVPGYKKIAQIKSLVHAHCLEQKPDLVISWTTGLSAWILWGAKKAKVKGLIAHCGNAPGTSFVGKYLYTYMTFWINKLIGAKIISCSEYVKDAFDAIIFNPKSNHFAVYNCINVAQFYPEAHTNTGYEVIMVGTFENHKDQKTLLEAWKLVENENPNAKLTLVGAGTLLDQMKSFASTLGLDRVSFLGNRNDVPALLRKSDLFVFSTTPAEGFGTVLIEALATGLPIVASDVPACHEVLRGGEYGSLVAPKDSKQLAKAIIAFATQADDELEKAKRIRYANQFTTKNMMDQYLKIVKL